MSDEVDIFDVAGEFLGRGILSPKSNDGYVIAIGFFILTSVVVIFTAPIWIGVFFLRHGGYNNASTRTKAAFVLSFIPWGVLVLSAIAPTIGPANLCEKVSATIQGNSVQLETFYTGDHALYADVSVNKGEEVGSAKLWTIIPIDPLIFEKPVKEVEIVRVYGYKSVPAKSGFQTVCFQQIYYP